MVPPWLNKNVFGILIRQYYYCNVSHMAKVCHGCLLTLSGTSQPITFGCLSWAHAGATARISCYVSTDENRHEIRPTQLYTCRISRDWHTTAQRLCRGHSLSSCRLCPCRCRVRSVAQPVSIDAVSRAGRSQSNRSTTDLSARHNLDLLLTREPMVSGFVGENGEFRPEKWNTHWLRLCYALLLIHSLT